MKKGIHVFSANSAALAVVMVSVFCQWPYSPERQAQGVTVQEADSRIFRVNAGQQICNPSISQDDVNYPGCMLWLNFSGPLSVSNPPAGYTLPAGQHDRLTISDSANNVRWFIKKPGDIPIEGEIQDPEWSTHPDYIVCIGGNPSGSVWDGYAVRVSDKKYLKFNDGKLAGIATPHIRLPDSVFTGGEADSLQYDTETGFVDRESVNDFFGTYDVRIVYAKVENGFTLYFIDYSQASPQPVKLAKPEGRETWYCESALISPDGDWVAYNCYENVEFYMSYVQQLSAGSQPYLVEEDACDPHWWVHPRDRSLVYLVYSKVTGSYFVKEDFTDDQVEQQGLAGSTVKQQVELFAGMPAHAGVQFAGSPQTLANLPFRGGLSRDGWYMCTGYAYGYIMGLQ
jgi:hypothetical protein